MKKILTLSLILMSTLPALAYVRDDTETGSLSGMFIFFAIFFIVAIVSLKNQDKNQH